MNVIHEVATLTSKGQVTLPKSIRQALGLDSGSRIAFDLQGTQVLVSRADEPGHVDPAITGLLALIEKDIQNGRNLSALPEGAVAAMLPALDRSLDLDADIDGDVDL